MLAEEGGASIGFSSRCGATQRHHGHTVEDETDLTWVESSRGVGQSGVVELQLAERVRAGYGCVPAYGSLTDSADSFQVARLRTSSRDAQNCNCKPCIQP